MKEDVSVLTLLLILIAPAVIFTCFKVISLNRSQTEYLQELYISYQAALKEYKLNHQDNAKKERCIALGREYYGKALPGPYGNRLQHLYTQLDLNKEFLLYQDQLVIKDLTLEDSNPKKLTSESLPTIPLVS